MKLLKVVTFVLLSLSLAAQKTAEPKWLPALAYGSAPDCPEHPGLRQNRSTVAVRPDGKTSAYLAGSASHTNDGSCRQVETLVIVQSGARNQVNLEAVTTSARELKQDPLEVPDRTRSYSIIDFSSDGRSVLLERTGTDDWHNHTFRDVDLGVLDITKPEQPKWIDVWDLMHWAKCNATVETQGFDGLGNPVLRVRPSVWQSKPRNDCVAKPELWAVDLGRVSTTRLPDETLLSRNGNATGVDWVTCQNDPDIVAACFTLHGRLSLWNGSPSLRIWRIGTGRILGVRTETTPENVSALFGDDPFATNIYGDFDVCPFTKEKAGEMQMVCIESASHLSAKER